MNDATSHTSPTPMSSETSTPATAAAVPAPAAQPEARLRIWPGVVIIGLEWFLLKVPGWVAPGTTFQFMFMFWAPMGAAVLLVVWWLLASRIPWKDRFLGLLVCIALGAGAWAIRDRSMGMEVLFVYMLPALTTTWVLWLLATPFLSWPTRRAGLLIVFLLAWGCFSLLRFDGVDGNFSATFHHRWAPTAEEIFLADIAAGKMGKPAAAGTPTAEVLTFQPGDWPGFRGPDRDGRRTGVRIATDWDQHPPRMLWRHRVGPGWSSFAVIGNRLFTQEQRGDDEMVVCYDAASGAEIWTHRDSARFTEAVAGPGPRATPTFHEGKIYAQGAAGKLNCLDAATGRVVWSRDIVADSGATLPTWGFAASPLVEAGIVTVFAGGPDGKSVLGYKAESGELAWSAGEGQYSYCSPQRARLGGIEQLLIATDVGLSAYDPAVGTVLWQHPWPLEGGMARIVQPALLDGSDVLVGTGFTNGTRRVRIGHGDSGWSTDEVWTSRSISPYFNDLVLHKGHLYGFDGNFFVCVNLENGKGKWKARGYGSGQVLLLPDQDLLLVLSEQGEVVLVDAKPDAHTERGRFQAIEGKTWNHPVVAHGKLFVRNGEEAACYELKEMSEAGEAR